MNHANPQRDRVMRSCNVADLVFNQNLARIGLVKSVRDTHRGGFAGAILPHDSVNRTRLDDDVHLVVGENLSKALGYVSEFEHESPIALNFELCTLCFVCLFYLMRLYSRTGNRRLAWVTTR